MNSDVFHPDPFVRAQETIANLQDLLSDELPYKSVKEAVRTGTKYDISLIQVTPDRDYQYQLHALWHLDAFTAARCLEPFPATDSLNGLHYLVASNSYTIVGLNRLEIPHTIIVACLLPSALWVATDRLLGD